MRGTHGSGAPSCRIGGKRSRDQAYRRREVALANADYPGALSAGKQASDGQSAWWGTSSRATLLQSCRIGGKRSRDQAYRRREVALKGFNEGASRRALEHADYPGALSAGKQASDGQSAWWGTSSRATLLQRDDTLENWTSMRGTHGSGAPSCRIGGKRSRDQAYRRRDPAPVALLSPGQRCLTSVSPTRTTRSGPLLPGSRACIAMCDVCGESQAMPQEDESRQRLDFGFRRACS
jgi:hypothetical protein